MIARVEPLTPARALRGPFDYRIGDALSDVGVGSMLKVPFGARRLLGVVVEVAEASDLPPERLVEPLAALEADVPPELVRLGLWVAREYVSTPAQGPGAGAAARHGHGRRQAHDQPPLAHRGDHRGRARGAALRRAPGRAPAVRARGAGRGTGARG